MNKKIYKLNKFKIKILNYIAKGHKYYDTEIYAEKLFVKMFPNHIDISGHAKEFAFNLQNYFYAESILVGIVM